MLAIRLSIHQQYFAFYWQKEILNLSFSRYFTLSQILFLFQNEHVMIEKLLKFFIAKIDAQLFKAIEVKDLKSSNVQNTNKSNPEKHKYIIHVIKYVRENKIESNIWSILLLFLTYLRILGSTNVSLHFATR